MIEMKDREWKELNWMSVAIGVEASCTKDESYDKPLRECSTS
jgi:hypothetical protein